MLVPGCLGASTHPQTPLVLDLPAEVEVHQGHVRGAAADGSTRGLETVAIRDHDGAMDGAAAQEEERDSSK